MKPEDQIIEAEVVEIDGVAVEPQPTGKASESKRAQWTNWGQWQGRIKTLDARWWPLWAILGLVLLVLLVAIGMCAAVLAVTYWICKSILIGIVSLISPSRELQRR